MKQIVSLVKDGQVSYAYVDDTTGEMTTFAQILLPHEDRFGLHESALLGTNLVQAIGLNGQTRKAPTPRVGEVARVERPDQPQLALDAGDAQTSPEPRKETPRDRRNRLAREAYAARTKKPAARRYAPNKSAEQRERMSRSSRNKETQRYISEEEIVAVIEQYPEGIRPRELAERIWRTTGDGSEQVPFWVTRAVENRVARLSREEVDGRAPAPYLVQYRPMYNAKGQLSGLKGKYLVPRPRTEHVSESDGEA